jgi:hypothetical protein
MHSSNNGGFFMNGGNFLLAAENLIEQSDLKTVFLWTFEIINKSG